jgi:hypothetical protein
MKELGLDGGSLNGLVAASAAPHESPSAAVATEEKPAIAHAENDDPAKPAKPGAEEDVEAAE